MWNMFIVNNEDTNILHLFNGVSFVDFEQVDIY